jgi:hypothetical protein
MMDKHTTMTTVPDELVTKLVLKKAALKREDAFAPEALLVARQGDKGDGNGSKAGKGSRSPKRDKSDNQRDINRKEKDFRKCFHCQRRGHTTENCLSNQSSEPPKSADTAAKASTETTSIEN